MGTTDSSTQLVEVPQDEGSIAQAVARLDSMISAWAAQMGQAQSALEHLARQEVPGKAEQRKAPELAIAAEQEPAVEKKPPPTQPAGQARSQQPPVVPKFTAEDAANVARSAPAAGIEKPKPHKEAARRNADGHKLSRFARLMRGKEKPDASSADEGNGARGKPSSASIDDDEALLASLDPKVAQAIRIKRRLSNGKKSVRELLEEG